MIISDVLPGFLLFNTCDRNLSRPITRRENHEFNQCYNYPQLKVTNRSYLRSRENNCCSVANYP